MIDNLIFLGFIFVCLWLMVALADSGSPPEKLDFTPAAERPPHWQSPEAHQRTMERIAALPHLPSPPLAPVDLDTPRRFGIRYRSLPEGEIYEVVIPAQSVQEAVSRALVMGLGVGDVVEVSEPPISEIPRPRHAR